MASRERVWDLFKQRALKEPKVAQLDKVLYKWFRAVHSNGKCLTGPMIIEKAKCFCDESN
jgi:hypothetical protein